MREITSTTTTVRARFAFESRPSVVQRTSDGKELKVVLGTVAAEFDCGTHDLISLSGTSNGPSGATTFGPVMAENLEVDPELVEWLRAEVPFYGENGARR